MKLSEISEENIVFTLTHFRTFSSRSALATAIFQWSELTPKEAFAAAMQSWRERCEKCVRLQGDYVEK